MHRLDVTNCEDIYTIAWVMREVAIDIVLNNAEIYLEPHYEGPQLNAIRYDD